MHVVIVGRFVTKMVVFSLDRCCYDALRLLFLKQDRKLYSFASQASALLLVSDLSPYRKGQEVVFLCLRHVDLPWDVVRAGLPLLGRGLEAVFPCLSERAPT